MLKTTLEQWRMFQAVVTHGGFSQAAEAIHKSQSTVHHGVQKLEESLNLSLFEVQGRKAHLTEAGKLMLRRASFLLEEAQKMESIANSLSAGIETKLAIAVDQVVPNEFLYCVLDEVSAAYPLLRIELTETVLSGGNELLEQDKVDIALAPKGSGHWLSEELMQLPFVAVANPDHPLHEKADQKDHQLNYEDLKSFRQIVVRDSALQSSSDIGWLEANQRWTVSHMRTSIDMVSRGLGFAWLPTPHIQHLLDDGSLKPLPLEQGTTRHSSIHLLFKDADRLGPAGKKLISLLREKSLTLV